MYLAIEPPTSRIFLYGHNFVLHSQDTEKYIGNCFNYFHHYLVISVFPFFKRYSVEIFTFLLTLFNFVFFI